MEILHSQNIIFFLFSFCYLVLNSLAYIPPDHYYINCGTSTSTTFGGRTFVGDVNPNSFTLSASHSSTAKNPSTDSLSSSSLYQTARIFRQFSSYDFDIVQNGIYVVRLHFYAFSSQDNLINARFDVSASKYSLLSNFSVQNSSSSNSATIKDFLISINVGKFQIYFKPSEPSSFAFINAIETFLAPDNFIQNSAPHIIPAGPQEDYKDLLSHALHVVHRINVGGDIVTPENDTLGRNWVLDDGYLFLRDAAMNAPFRSERPHYLPGRATEFDAPDRVYNTAKVLNLSTSQDGILLPPEKFNATWRFVVNKNAMFLVRVHFCDILTSRSANDALKFNLYIYSHFSKLINPLDISQTELAVPFYIDFVVDSDDSGFMFISIGQDSSDQAAFLNGVEIMELVGISGLSPNRSKEGKKHLPVIIGSVAGGVVLIIIAVLLLWFSLKLRKGKPDEAHDWQLMNLNAVSSYSRSTERNVINGSPLPDLNLGLKMPLGDILHATKNFDEKLIIGEGGFGKVYRGTLKDGTKVAVKRSEPGRTQGFPEFQTEILVLSKIRHRHLVSLIGYCDERSEMVLVYDFMEKGSLRDHLYTSKEKYSAKATSESGLSWEKRLELCIDAAKGLHYLHTGLGGSIIHRDVKSTNILLDEHYVAKVADFGISRLGPLDQGHVSTEVKGTFGYLDPEYYRCLQLTQKSDVYSFGVVLLEVLCARPAIDNLLPREQVNLAEWAMSCLEKGELDKTADPSLVNKINSNSLRRFGETVEKCLKECGADRPNMVDVLWDLEYALQLQHTAVPGQSREDSNTDVSYNLPLPVLNRLPTHSIAMSDDEMGMSDDEMASDTHTDRISTNASEVFSQLRMDEAR